MNPLDRNTTLDEVLAEYARAAEGFDAKLLQKLVDRYPDHAAALHRYAHVQLSSARATAGEIAAEEVPVPEGRPDFLAVKKLEGISGEQGMRAAATAVFGACRHGEDMLLMLIKDSGITDVPAWILERLAKYIGMPMSLVRQSLPLQGHAQSYKGKPAQSAPVSWADAVKTCISDEETRRALLNVRP